MFESSNLGRNSAQITDYRLSQSDRGLIEVEFRGAWGTVCDDGFDHPDGRGQRACFIVCRTLNFT